jgi:1-acyl-sn-glycerol-3-phosphate acyltransferase
MRREFPWKRPNWPEQIPKPPKPAALGADYDTSWARKEPVRVLRNALFEAIGRPALAWLASPVVVGSERLESLEAPAIFAANHQSHVDTPLVLSCLPERFRRRAVVAAGADYFFDRTWKAVLSAGLLGAIPMERARVSRRSSYLALELLEDGWSVVIFPEGGRSPDGWGRPFRAGAAFLAQRSGVAVVPVHLAGTRAIHAKGSNQLHRGSVRVTFGEAIRPEKDESVYELSARIQRAVEVLADEQATSWYEALRRQAELTTPSMLGPSVESWRRIWALGGRAGPQPKSGWPWDQLKRSAK